MKKIAKIAAAAVLSAGALGLSVGAQAANPDNTVAKVSGPTSDSGLSTVGTRSVSWTTHVNSSWAHNDVTGVGGGFDNFNKKVDLVCNLAAVTVVNATGHTVVDDDTFLTCATGQALTEARAALTLL